MCELEKLFLHVSLPLILCKLHVPSRVNNDLHEKFWHFKCENRWVARVYTHVEMKL